MSVKAHILIDDKVHNVLQWGQTPGRVGFLFQRRWNLEIPENLYPVYRELIGIGGVVPVKGWPDIVERLDEYGQRLQST